jgi:putative transposase
MARPLRIEYPGAFHHVTSRGNERRPVFRSDVDRKMFLQFLDLAVERFGWSVTAYVLMTNHFHLVIETPEPNLSRGMHWLNTSYVGWFNHRHKRAGHLFQGRFHSVLIEKSAYFAQVLRYVVLNPVRANMTARPEDYRWSSYRATAGLETAPRWLDLDSALAVFGADSTSGQAGYQQFVLAHLDSHESLWDNVQHGMFLGSDEWMIQMRALVDSKPRSTDHPRKQRSVGRPAMATIMEVVRRAGSVTMDELRSRGSGTLRWLVAWLGWNEGLATLRQIAAVLRLRSEGYVSSLIRRCERQFASSCELLRLADEALAALRS